MGCQCLAVLAACLGACLGEGGIYKQIDASESYATKVYGGISQALQFLSELVTSGEGPTRPPRKVKLAVVGFGRTGSTSFAAAMQELGYSPAHDDQLTEVADLYGAWWAGTLSVEEFNVELGRRGFDAPWAPVHKYVEWAAAAPDVKVIMTVRDKRKWAESYLHLAPMVHIAEMRPFKWLKVMQVTSAFNRESLLNVPTNGHPELYDDVPTLEAGYDVWVDFVRKTVPKERLLEFSVKEGWGPLCEFLVLPEPSKPFPHINDRAMVDVIIKVFVLISWVWPLLFASPLLLLWCCLRCCCHRRIADSSKKCQ